MDWKETLAALKQNSDLPEGEDTQESVSSNEPRRTDRLHISIEKKGRKGKTATIIDGFTCSDSELEDIARSLKQKIGTGGSARGGEILIQGEWKDKVSAILSDLGYRFPEK